ncbi:MAG: FecR domain-containing protein [Bdellovibrio sp.]
MSGFGRTEKIILGCAVALLMVFSYFLYDDSLLFPKNVNNKLELIGDVFRSQNDVRRKNLDTFSWLPANPKDKVFQNDSIFTGDRSEAVIRLQDGTQIQIKPNSMITLNLKNGQMDLNLRYGDLTSELAKNSTLTIHSDGEEFKVENGSGSQEKSQIEFKKNHSGATDLKLLSGKVKYSNPKKKTVQEIAKNDQFSIAKNGETKKTEKPVLTLKNPDNSTLLKADPQDPIAFDWSSKGELSHYELEVSNKEDFNTLVLSKTTANTQIQITDPLDPGVYFWRLKAISKDGTVSAISDFKKMTVEELSAPQITAPQAEANMNLEIKAKPKEPLTLATEIQWTANSQLKNFTWQISQDEEFKSILKEGQTQSFAALTPKLPGGTYWVRVKGLTAQNKNSSWSETVSFSLNLTAQKEEPPKPPILVTKKIDFRAPSENERSPSSAPSPQLAWKPVLQVKNYHLQISKDIQFKDPKKYDVKQTIVNWSDYKPGKYFYRVYARGINGLVSEPSETGTIDISVGGITLSPLKPINEIAPQPSPKEIPAKWSDVAFAKRYLLQVDKDENFKQPQQFEFSTNQGSITLPDPGSYKVRVQALNEENNPLTEFSNIQEALYSYRKPLGIPVLLEPFNQASIFLQTEMEPFIWLEWKKVERATSYNIEISDKPDFSRLLIAKSLKGNRFLIKEKVPLGEIYWRVQAISQPTEEKSKWSELREFTLYHQKNEGFIK